LGGECKSNVSVDYGFALDQCRAQAKIRNQVAYPDHQPTNRYNPESLRAKQSSEDYSNKELRRHAHSRSRIIPKKGIIAMLRNIY
jgi:hypothetical protein